MRGFIPIHAPALLCNRISDVPVCKTDCHIPDIFLDMAAVCIYIYF